MIDPREPEIAEYTAMHSLRMTADHFNIGFRKVRKIREKHGISNLSTHPKHKSGSYAKITDVKKQAVAEYLRTHTWAETVERYGCSNTTISKIVKEFDIKRVAKEEIVVPKTRRDEWQRLRDDGVTVFAIARQYRTSHKTVSSNTTKPKISYYMKRKNKARINPEKYYITKEDEGLICDLYAEDEARASIAKKFGCPTDLVKQILRDNGLMR